MPLLSTVSVANALPSVPRLPRNNNQQKRNEKIQYNILRYRWINI